VTNTFERSKPHDVLVVEVASLSSLLPVGYIDKDYGNNLKQMGVLVFDKEPSKLRVAKTLKKNWMTFLKVLEVAKPRHTATFGLRGANFRFAQIPKPRKQSSTRNFCRPMILLKANYPNISGSFAPTFLNLA